MEAKRDVEREPESLPAVEPAVEPSVETPRIELTSSALRCPYCHDSFPATKPTSVCAACLARHHAACWRTHGKCASCAGTDELVPRSSTPPVARRRAPVGWALAVMLLAFALFGTLWRMQQQTDLADRFVRDLRQLDSATKQEKGILLRERAEALREAKRLENELALAQKELAELRARAASSAFVQARTAVARRLVLLSAEYQTKLADLELASPSPGTSEKEHAAAIDCEAEGVRRLAAENVTGERWAEGLAQLLAARRHHQLAGDPERHVQRIDRAIELLLAGQDPGACVEEFLGPR